ncbi:iron-sulfur cluster co-chaperone, mitochondrial [Solea senegalensis]|uniref:Iron-sulfur cluster co-chaperone protein HscB n=1 Tax=Solea senegalensis TaxID=28829 RepID=A0AAV6QFI1_SOLSE|nr:iron-sulfur cluster co-chaperone protein HscB isoform X1 [Solea senegalensis]KAG7490598.1 iron-sulfur cluster co-chaperone, mitochondrial [Solea senegalensis]
MLSAKPFRAACSSWAVLMWTNRLCISKVCMSTSFSIKDTWHCNRNVRSLLKARGLTCNTNQSSTLWNNCSGRSKVSCWSCKQPLDQTPAFFCVSCKVVQPPEEGTSYFKIMACDYTFTLDTQQLQKKYLQLQRLLHPDNFSQKSVTEQQYSESQSALVNKAYTTLLKPLSRGLYMLELEGMHIKEGTESAHSAFFMELMEINEALDEAQTPEEANKIGQDTKGKLAELTEQIDTALRKGELQNAQALLIQMKYFANIEEKVKEKLCHFM